MPGLRHLFRCLAEALCANGLKALAHAVPLGAVLYEVAENAAQRLREQRQDDQIRALAEAGAADPAEVKAEAAAVSAEVAADQPPEVRERLAAYLAQVPAAVRRSQRQPGAALFTFGVRRPEDLLQLLPPRLPRFQPGDRPPGQGDWVLDELLGAGGFGEVWKARHAFFDGIAPVALKFCLDPQAKERLLHHEAAVLNRVMRHGRHPGIVPLLDATLSSDPPCLKYEYIEGGDLAGLVAGGRAGGAEWREKSAVLLQLARVVAFAHRLSPPIVHRDLKPTNVLVQKRPDGGHDLRVTDFGIGGVAAQQALAEARLGTSLRGSHTPLYASPQQARGEPPDPRDDVHALGVIWYQMLTGDLTTGAPTGLWGEELQEQGVPPEAARLLGACVAARAEKRPADAGALADELEKLLQPPAPVIVPAPGAARRSDERLDRFLHSGQTGALSWLLDLSNRRIGDEGAKALAGCARLANLSVLLLSGCEVGDEGTCALAASPHVLNLTRLDLWDNRIGDAGVAALASCRYLENLTRLDLGRNRVGDAGIVALAASEHLRNLSELLLVSNHVGDEGALALARSPHLANLAWLKPLDNRISAKGAEALKAAFGKRVRVM